MCKNLPPRMPVVSYSVEWLPFTNDTSNRQSHSCFCCCHSVHQYQGANLSLLEPWPNLAPRQKQTRHRQRSQRCRWRQWCRKWVSTAVWCSVFKKMKKTNFKVHCSFLVSVVCLLMMCFYIWYDIGYDMIWYDMIWYDMIWYDMTWQVF